MTVGHANSAVFLPPPGRDTREAHSEYKVCEWTCARARVRVDFWPAPSDGRPGTRWIVSGTLALSGPSVRVYFRNLGLSEVPGGGAPMVTESPLLPPDTSVRIQPRVLRCRTDQAPYLWVSFVDGSRRILSSPIEVGRLDADEITVGQAFETPVQVSTSLAAHHDGGRGASLGLTGQLVVRHGIVMQLVMSQTNTHAVELIEAPQTKTIEIVPPQFSLEFEPQTVVPGVIERPFVSMVLRDWSGRVAGAESRVGWIEQV